MRATNKQVAKWKSPYILMVDRGDCTFVTKVRAVLWCRDSRGGQGVSDQRWLTIISITIRTMQVRHAQHAGASGVLVADNLCVCKDISCHPDPGTTCQVRPSSSILFRVD